MGWPKGKKHSKESREKIRIANIGKRNPMYGKPSAMSGKKHSKESRDKMSQSHKGQTSWSKGKHLSEEHKLKISLANSRGENVGYQALHIWIRKQLGKPDTCEHCGINGLSGRSIHWANKSREYKRRLDDWIRLCVSCHKKYDSGQES